MGISGGKHAELQVRKERKNEFGARRQKIFLQHFANSCNISAAANHAGVSRSTVWLRRRHDQQFREAFEQAQESAIASLKLELISRGLDLVRATDPDEACAPALAGMDAKFLMSLVTQHQRSVGSELGDQLPKRSDASQASARLYALLLRMRAERARDEERARQRSAK